MATIIGTSAGEILGATGMTSGADRISASAGNDTLVYELSTAGGSDAYYGGTGVDVLELRFTAAEWAVHSAKVLALQSSVASAAKPVSGAVAAGTKSGALDFGSGKVLNVYEVESVKIYIDGVEYGTTPPPPPVNKEVSITSAAQAGSVVEDGKLSATGTIAFTDADLADAHTVSVAPVDGALGTFVLGAVSESATTAAGSVGWTYNLDNSSAAVQALAAGQVVTETYVISVSDGKGSTVTQNVTVTITGAYDAPSITVTNTGAVVEAGAASAGTPEAAGKMPLDGVAAAAVWDVYTEPGGDIANNGYDWGTFTITPNGQWKFTLDQAKADALTEGEEVPLTFAVTATEAGAASVRRVVTITLTGADDATKISVENGSDLTVTEANGLANDESVDPGASGKLNAVDPDDAVEFEVATIAGTYGDLSIDAQGNWGYALRNGDTNVQALKDGQVVTDSITVKATDGTTFALKLTVTGADDVATMTIVDTLTTSVDDDGFLLDADGVKVSPDKLVTVAQKLYDNLVHEAPGKDHAGNVDSTTSGKIALSDPDGGSLQFHALDSAARDDDQFAGSVAQGTYGSFSLNTSTGEWTYTLDNTLDATQLLTGAETLEDTYDSVVIWSADGKSSQEIKVHVKGADDGYTKVEALTDDPAYNTVVFQETTTDVDGTPGPDKDAGGNLILVLDDEANGKLLAIDPDGNEQTPVFVPITAKATQYGTFSIDADGVWSYKANLVSDKDAAVDSNKDGILDNDADLKTIYNLAKGEVVTETIIVKTEKDTNWGTQASYAINIRLTGANDVATLQDVTVGADGKRVDVNGDLVKGDTAVTESGGVNNATVGDKEAKGIIKFVDADTGESAFAAATPATKAGAYGTFKLNTSTGAWTYTLDEAKANVLRANETVEEKWDLVSKDGSKGTLVVNVVGADDATTITKVSGDYVAKEAGGVNNAVKGDATAGGTLSIVDPDGSAEDSEATFANVFGVASGKETYDISNPAKPVLIPVTQAGLEAAMDASAPAAAAADGKIWGQYGYFTFDGDAKKWAYTLVEAPIATTNAALDSDTNGLIDASQTVSLNTQGLAAGQKAVDVLRVYSSNLASFVDLRVDITGANDTASITNTPSESLVLQAAGFEPVVTAGKVTGAVAVVADETTSGTVQYFDPDLDANKDGNADDPTGAASSTTFKTMTLAQRTGKFGVFDFDNTTGDWTYHLNSYDKDTRALLIGQKATDQLTVTAADGTVQTITVTVNGANNAPTLVPVIDTATNLPKDDGAGGIVFNVPTVNKDGSITYQVIDGDAGAKLTLQVVETVDVNGVPTDVVRDVPAVTVVDGGVSIVKLATANSTVLYQGTMQVTDKTIGHDAVNLGTFLGIGTSGKDNITSTSTVGSLISGMDGDDSITSGTGTDYISGGNGNDTVDSSDGNDTVLGGAGNDSITSGDGKSLLQGDAGNDTLSAGGDNDTVLGGVGNDSIDGGAGDDRIQGDAGIDTLTGGTEADTFVFLTSATDFVAAKLVADTITDFETGVDHLLVSKALLQSSYYKLTDVQKADGSAGTDGIFETIKLTKAVGAAKIGDNADGAWFKEADMNDSGANVGKPVVASSLTADDRFIYESGTGTLWYDADGNGAGVAQRVAELGAGTPFAYTDIQFG